LEAKGFKIDKRKVIAAAKQYKKKVDEERLKKLMKACKL